MVIQESFCVTVDWATNFPSKYATYYRSSPFIGYLPFIENFLQTQLKH